MKFKLKPTVALLGMLTIGSGTLMAQVINDSLAMIQQAQLRATEASLRGEALPQLPLQNQDAQRVVLSREDCIRIALQDNPTIRVADMEVQRVDYSKKEVLASLFPKIDFTGAYQRNIELQAIKMNMGGQTNTIKMGMDNSWNLGFSAALPLVNATLWESIKLSDVQILSNLEKARTSRLDLINNINKAYYALLLAQSSYNVLKDNYELAKFTAQLYEKQFNAGVASEYDVLRSSVQVKNMEPDILQAEIAIRQCQLQLKMLMGMDANVEVLPNVTLEQMQQDMYAYLLDVDRNLSNNSSLRELDVQTSLLDHQVKLKKYAWIPTLSAQFSLAWSALSNGNPVSHQEFNPYSNVALALSVPIFSGGSKYYGLKGAQIQRAEMDLQRENLLNALNMQVDLAIDNINKEVAQIETTKESVKQAEKAHQIMMKSFEIGAGSYLNLRDSEMAETAAKLVYYQAIYNYLVSTSDLDHLLGKEDELTKAGYNFPNRK